MPKDEFDFEDPLELNGVAFLTVEDTSFEMADCFAEEFLRMGYNHKQVLALFRNPHYLGPHMVLQKKGEGFVRQLISDVFARWGRAFRWSDAEAKLPEAGRIVSMNFGDTKSALTDPLGNSAPEFNL